MRRLFGGAYFGFFGVIKNKNAKFGCARGRGLLGASKGAHEHAKTTAARRNRYAHTVFLVLAIPSCMQLPAKKAKRHSRIHS